MGARYLICVVQGGEYRIAQYGHEFQYGQWSGYFEALGKRVIKFLTTTDTARFSSQVAKLKVLTSEEVNSRWAAARAEARREFGYDAPLKALHLSQEFGSNILNYVMNTTTPEVRHSLDFAGDSLFCEFAYVINLDTRSLEIFTGFNQTPLSESERFYGFEKRPGNQEDFARRAISGKLYYPIKHFYTIPFAELSAGTVTELAVEESLGVYEPVRKV